MMSLINNLRVVFENSDTLYVSFAATIPNKYLVQNAEFGVFINSAFVRQLTASEWGVISEQFCVLEASKYGVALDKNGRLNGEHVISIQQKETDFCHEASIGFSFHAYITNYDIRWRKFSADGTLNRAYGLWLRVDFLPPRSGNLTQGPFCFDGCLEGKKAFLEFHCTNEKSATRIAEGIIEQSHSVTFDLPELYFDAGEQLISEQRGAPPNLKNISSMQRLGTIRLVVQDWSVPWSSSASADEFPKLSGGERDLATHVQGNRAESGFQPNRGTEPTLCIPEKQTGFAQRGEGDVEGSVEIEDVKSKLTVAKRQLKSLKVILEKRSASIESELDHMSEIAMTLTPDELRHVNQSLYDENSELRQAIIELETFLQADDQT